MAQESKDKKREVDEDEASDERGTSDASDEPHADEASPKGSAEMMRVADDDALANVPGDSSSDDGGEDGEALDGEEGEAAAQLGSDRYVLAGFFAAGMLGAYVLGRAIQSAWVAVAPKDWFAQSVPFLAAVPDDDKQTYGILLGGLIALVVVYRTYKKPEVRAWSDEVAAELAKVVWPSRKDVTSSTFIVIVSSAAATIYLALLDRLWAFITNIVYGDGS